MKIKCVADGEHKTIEGFNDYAIKNNIDNSESTIILYHRKHESSDFICGEIRGVTSWYVVNEDKHDSWHLNRALITIAFGAGIIVGGLFGGYLI